jgi:valyl-tRNA synthetase
MESQGRDIKLDEKRVEGYRNFATKLWNAARFAQSNGIGGSTTLEPPAATQAVNRWIIAETVKTIQALDLALADLRFDESANTIYHFVWSQFCDWYLELTKPILQGEDQAAADETRAVAGWVLDQILVLLHPFMPFITEELWHALAARDHDLIVAKWPMADARAIDLEASAEIAFVIEFIEGVRKLRTDLNIPPSVKLPLWFSRLDREAWNRFSANEAALFRLCRLESVAIHPMLKRQHKDLPLSLWIDRDWMEMELPEGGSAQLPGDGYLAFVRLEGLIDLEAERVRLAKGAEAAEKEAAALAGRLNNPAFVEKAKPEAVAKAREDHAAKAAEAERLRAALARLG